jgi:3-hydroxybutyryl-CoA dehydrogenase
VDVGDVRKVAVIGAGTMGPGLAQVFAGAGYPVSLYSRSEATLEQAMSVAAANVATFVRHGLIDADDATTVLTRISPTRRLEDAADGAGLVIEAIAEDMDAKGAVFGSRRVGTVS